MTKRVVYQDNTRDAIAVFILEFSIDSKEEPAAQHNHQLYLLH